MSQPADSLSAVDLKSVTAGGLVREDVLAQIYNISPYETPALDAVGGGSYSNPFYEWTQDSLAAPALADAQIDGADITPATSATGARVGNHGQITTAGVNVSETVLHTDNVGRSDEMGYQTAKRLQEMQTNIEATLLSNQASVADTGSVAGKTAGLGAWLETNTSHGSGGSAGGFNTSTKIVDAPTAGTSRALTWAMLADRIEAAYLLGAKPSLIVTRPELTKRLGIYLIGSAYFVAPVANIGGEKVSNTEMSGYVDTFKTDFGYTMTIRPSRNQQLVDSADTNSTADACVLFGIDPQYLEVPRMWGTKIEPLAKQGLSVRKMISTHWGTRPLLEKAHFGIYDLQPSAAVAAS